VPHVLHYTETSIPYSPPVQHFPPFPFPFPLPLFLFFFFLLPPLFAGAFSSVKLGGLRSSVSSFNGIRRKASVAVDIWIFQTRENSRIWKQKAREKLIRFSSWIIAINFPPLTTEEHSPDAFIIEHFLQGLVAPWGGNSPWILACRKILFSVGKFSLKNTKSGAKSSPGWGKFTGKLILNSQHVSPLLEIFSCLLSKNCQLILLPKLFYGTTSLPIKVCTV